MQARIREVGFIVAVAVLASGTGSVLARSDDGAAKDDWQPMYEVDFYGNDIAEIIYEAPGSDWRTCQAACEAERECQAWTYVVPGRSEHGECYLKAPVPEPAVSECCTSGVKGGASAGGARRDEAIALGMRKGD